MDNDNRQRRGTGQRGAALHTVLSTVLVVATIASAVGVVAASHQSRQLFGELQVQKRQGLQLNEEWGRLLLEESTWASHDRVQQVAREDLAMVKPQPKTIRMVRIDGQE